MLLCDEIVADPIQPNKFELRGLIHAIRLKEPIRLPAVIDQLCVLLYLTGGRGVGNLQIVGLEADTDREVFVSLHYRIEYPPDPLELVTRSFRLRQCIVPRPGLYWIQLKHNGRTLTEQPLTVR